MASCFSLQLRALNFSSSKSAALVHGSGFQPNAAFKVRLPWGRCASSGSRDGRHCFWELKSRKPFQVSRAEVENADGGSIALEEEELSEDEEQDRRDISDINTVLELLQKKRDMTFSEVKLTIMIEDPREVERRRQLGIEDERGCSREDLGNGLVEVYEGRIPQDRVVLRELAKEMLNWPNLEDEGGRTSPAASPYAKVTNTGVDPRVAAERAKVDWDTAADITPGEAKKELGERLPPFVGYSFLYLVSSIPVIIGVSVVLILFLNSLQ